MDISCPLCVDARYLAEDVDDELLDTDGFLVVTDSYDVGLD